MTLTHILVFLVGALLHGYWLRGRWRGWVLLGLSLLAVFWLQPSTPIRYLDFWLPTGSIALSVFVWAAVSRPSPETKRINWITGAAIVVIIVLVSLLRYFEPICCLTPTRPPDLISTMMGVGALAILAGLNLRLGAGKKPLAGLFILAILVLFIVLKTEPLSLAASIGLRNITGQSANLASSFDIRWLGISYIAFRLLHVLRDHQTGRANNFNLQEFLIYVLFFPALSAGPIDRAPRFAQDLRKPFQLTSKEILAGGERLVIGIFKKFVLADTLAVVALSEVSSQQVVSTGWMWVMLYAYALRIYFDFSGYTDIAIGMGRLFGITLPENFEKPYLKPNLTLFWNSWHITLAQWFRAYFFNPITRALRTQSKPIPMFLIILIG
ncbi:MAG: hypothetical protein MUC85_10425, partial [Anaerolineales bacterium]|nr:hypothetical protein [Anaerolineales bacterium]